MAVGASGGSTRLREVTYSLPQTDNALLGIAVSKYFPATGDSKSQSKLIWGLGVVELQIIEPLLESVQWQLTKLPLIRSSLAV